MVISSIDQSKELKKPMAMATRSTTQSNPNFSMPVFKWGLRKHLRFMKTDPEDPISLEKFPVSDARIDGFKAGKDAESVKQTAGNCRSGEFREPCFSSSSSSQDKLQKPPFIGGLKKMKLETEKNDSVDDLREKLLIHLRPLRKSKDGEESMNGVGISSVDKIAVSEEESPKLWNRRTRSATFRVANEIEEKQRRDLDNQQKSQGVRSPCLQNLEKEMPKFLISLTRPEIEEDFIAMTGNKAPQRPRKKRSKMIQRRVEAVSPGQWLCDITPDSYKVVDEPESRKMRS